MILRAISSLIATRDSLTFTITFPFRLETIVTVSPATKPSSSRCFLTAKIGDTVKVVKLHGEGPIKRRIMDMGITKGTEVYIRKVAPLGDPMEVTVRGYELSLRKADTEMIEIA